MNEGIAVWSFILITPVVFGALSGLFIKSNLDIKLAAAVPWFSLLAVLLIFEIFVPYQGGGASMWPIAQLIGGTIMAVIGICTCLLTRKMKINPNQAGDDNSE